MGTPHQGVALATWRHRKKLSQVEAAANLGVAQAAWAAWETGRKTPDLENALGLEKLTGGAISAAKWTGKRKRRRRTRDRTKRRAQRVSGPALPELRATGTDD